MAKGTPEGGQGEANGTPKGTKGAQRTPKGNPRAPKGFKSSPKSGQGKPKALQRNQREKIYTKNTQSTAQADVMLIWFLKTTKTNADISIEQQ